MSGVVHDANGGLVPGVSVTAKHTESGLTRTAITNETGSYRMPALPVAAYEVTAELSGFKQQIRRSGTRADYSDSPACAMRTDRPTPTKKGPRKFPHKIRELLKQVVSAPKVSNPTSAG